MIGGFPRQTFPSATNPLLSQNNGSEDMDAVLNQILKLGNATAQLGGQIATNTSQSAFETSQINAQGLENILDIDKFSNQANLNLDLYNLSARGNFGVFAKQIEQYLFDASNREKLENLFFDLEKTEMQNRFGLAKSVVGAARYG